MFAFEVLSAVINVLSVASVNTTIKGNKTVPNKAAGRKINQKISRIARKRRQRRAARSRQVRLSVSVRAIRRNRTAIKTARRQVALAAATAAIAAMLVAGTKPVPAPQERKLIVKPKLRVKPAAPIKRKNAAAVERPLISRQAELVSSAALLARRELAMGIRPEVQGQRDLAYEARMEALRLKAEAIRRRRELMVEEAIGAPSTKTVVCSMDNTLESLAQGPSCPGEGIKSTVEVSLETMGYNQLLAAQKAAADLSVAQLKELAAQFNLAPVGDKRRKATWLDAVREHYSLLMSKVAVVNTVVDEVLPEKVEAVVKPYSPQHVQSLIAQAFPAPMAERVLAQIKEANSSEALAPQHLMYAALLGAVGMIRSQAPVQVDIYVDLQKAIKAAGGNYIVVPGMEHMLPSLSLLNCEQVSLKGTSKVVNAAIATVSEQVGKLLSERKVPKDVRKAYQSPLVRAIAHNRALRAPVVVPAELYAFAKQFNLQQGLLPLDSAAIKPVTGFGYKRAKQLFANIEANMQTGLYSPNNDAAEKARKQFAAGKKDVELMAMPEAIADRPMSFVDRGEEFDLYLGAHVRITVRSNEEVTIYRLDRRLRLTLQKVLWVAPIFYGEQQFEDTALLSPIDQLLYHFEQYLSVDLNRYYTALTANYKGIKVDRMRDVVQNYLAHSLYEYLAKHSKSEMAVAVYENSMRRLFTSNTVAVVEGVVNLPLVRTASGFVRLITVGDQGTKANVTLKKRINEVSLVTREQSYGLIRRCISAAAQHDLALLPFGDMKFVSMRFLTWSSNAAELEVVKKDLLETYAGNGVKFYGRELDVTVDYDFIVGEIDKSMRARQPEKFDGLTVNTPAWWEVAANLHLADWSTKLAKSAKRNASNFAQVCEVEHEEPMAFMYHGEAYAPTARVVKAALGLQHPVAPGIGYSRPGTFVARYEISGKRHRFFTPAKENPIVFTEEFAPLVVEDNSTKGLIGFRFTEPVEVKAGTVVAYYRDNREDTHAIEAEYDALLDRVNFTYGGEAGQDKFYVTLHYIRRTPTVKLRYGVKLNAVNAHIDALFNWHGADSKAIDLFVPLDCNKWMDSADFPYPVIAETFKRTSWGRELLARANAIVGVDADDVLVFDKTARITGKYDFLYDEFVARFGRRIWFNTRDNVGEYQEVMTAMLQARSDWRAVTAEELATLRAETGFDAEATDLVVLTNAGDVIRDVEDCIFASWTGKGGVSHVLIGGFGFMGTAQEPLFYPVTVEYTVVEQAITDTSMMPFSLVDTAARNKAAAEYAKQQVKASDYRGDLDIMLSHMLDNRALLSRAKKMLPTATAKSVFKDGFAERMAAARFKVVDGKEVALKPSEWMAVVAEAVGEVSLIVKTSTHEDGYRHLYLPVITYLAGRSVDTSDATIADRVYTWLTALSNGYDAENKDLVSLADDIFRMMQSFRDGVTHKKSILRGADTVYAKAAALPVVPTSCVYVRKGGKLARKILARFGKEVKYLGFRRMPMTRSAVFELKFVGNEGWVGAYQLSGDRFYFGLFGQYFNWGDLDGDSDEFGDMTEAVARGLVAPDNLESLKELFRNVLGTDMLDKAYWDAVAAGDAPAQYWADHFAIPSHATLMAKIGLSLKKTMTTRGAYVDFQKAAHDAQTIGVGTTYRATCISLMTNELLPVLAEHGVLSGIEVKAYDGQLDLFGTVDTQANPLYERLGFMLDAVNGLSVCHRVQQLYEVALGGYDEDMANVVLGYFARIIRWEEDMDWATLPFFRKAAKTSAAGVDIFPELGADYGARLTVTRASALTSFKALGFAEADFGRFEQLFQVAGLCKNLGKVVEGGEFDGNAVRVMDLIHNKKAAFAFGVTEVILNVTQGRYAQGDNSLTVESLRAYAEAAVAQDPSFAAFRDALLTDTVTGLLFARFARTKRVIEVKVGDKTVEALLVDSFDSFRGR